MRFCIFLASFIFVCSSSSNVEGSPTSCSELLRNHLDLAKFEIIQINEITNDSKLSTLNPTGVVDFIKTYFTNLPEGLVLGGRDLRHNFFNEDSIRPELFVMNQRKALKAKLWRNHFGFLIHSSAAIGVPYFMGPELLPGVVAVINGYSSVRILVTTGALKRKHRLYQVLGYIK